MAEVLNPAYFLRVARAYNQALITLNQMDEFDGCIRQIFLQVGYIIGSIFGIQKVRAGQVADTAFNCHQPPHAAHMA